MISSLTSGRELPKIPAEARIKIEQPLCRMPAALQQASPDLIPLQWPFEFRHLSGKFWTRLLCFAD
ncbi:hypothetical protein [Paraburkholderia mimosarum]|uniref:hypothetical protein n=1 Tax=Paraburkholderia mimosarum TaxID=312026 RepID=UPI00138E5230|nr:hypothetical protein [Paraburkholderia mimosarum]